MFSLDPHISKTPGFPKDGITFYDISPALEDAVILKKLMAAMAEQTAAFRPEIIAGIDARGFLFALPLSLELDCGTVMIRKSGKLPGKVLEESYALNMAQHACLFRPHGLWQVSGLCYVMTCWRLAAHCLRRQI